MEPKRLDPRLILVVGKKSIAFHHQRLTRRGGLSRKGQKEMRRGHFVFHDGAVQTP
jgi:hypothetical protein